MFEIRGCGLMLNVETAGCVMLLECIGIVSLLLSSSYYLAPLTPPLLTTPRKVWSSSSAPESLSLTLDWNLNVEDNVGVVARNVVVTVVVVGLKGAAPSEVWSPHIVISRHHTGITSLLSCSWDTSLAGLYFILMMPHCWDPLSVSAALLNCCSSNDHGNSPDWAWTSWHRTSGNIQLKNMNILKSISCKYIQWM